MVNESGHFCLPCFDNCGCYETTVTTTHVWGLTSLLSSWSVTLFHSPPLGCDALNNALYTIYYLTTNLWALDQVLGALGSSPHHQPLPVTWTAALEYWGWHDARHLDKQATVNRWLAEMTMAWEVNSFLQQEKSIDMCWTSHLPLPLQLFLLLLHTSHRTARHCCHMW